MYKEFSASGGFDVDDNVPISHADVTKLDSELISREDHIIEFGIISIKLKLSIRTGIAYYSEDTTYAIMRSGCLRATILSGCST